jgi:hypothetical protein
MAAIDTSSVEQLMPHRESLRTLAVNRNGTLLPALSHACRVSDDAVVRFLLESGCDASR